MPNLWVPLALAAGLLQSVRNGVAKSLAGEISPALNSWSRFAFNLPFATVLVAVLVVLHGAPTTSVPYYAFCLGTGVTQLLGNMALIAAFRHANFAQAIVLHKLEIVFTAIVGVLFFGEFPTVVGLCGILLSATGVVLMQLGTVTNRSDLLKFDRGSLLSILAGLFLVFASFLLKEATAELAAWNPRVGSGRFEVAAHTLFNVTWMEVVILTLWLRVRRPGELSLVPVHWRRMLVIGFTGFLGSLGWFWAYSLTLVAYVKAVGQIEAVAAIVYSLLIWNERGVYRQLPGIALVLFGIVLVLLG